MADLRKFVRPKVPVSLFNAQTASRLRQEIPMLDLLEKLRTCNVPVEPGQTSTVTLDCQQQRLTRPTGFGGDITLSFEGGAQVESFGAFFKESGLLRVKFTTLPGHRYMFDATVKMLDGVGHIEAQSAYADKLGQTRGTHLLGLYASPHTYGELAIYGKEADWAFFQLELTAIRTS